MSNIKVSEVEIIASSKTPSRKDIFSNMVNDNPYVVTDPDGKLYNETAELARKEGYLVKVLNLKEPSKSDKWNPLDILFNEEKTAFFSKAKFLTFNIVKNTKVKKIEEDPFFSRAEENLLYSLVQYVAKEESFKGERSLASVYDLLLKMDADKDGNLEELGNLPDSAPGRIAYKIYTCANKYKHDYVLNLLLRLEALKDEDVRVMLSSNEIDTALPTKEKCAYYVIPSEKEELDFLIPIFFSYVCGEIDNL